MNADFCVTSFFFRRLWLVHCNTSRVRCHCAHTVLPQFCMFTMINWVRESSPWVTRYATIIGLLAILCFC